MSDGPSVYRTRILLDPLRQGAFTEHFKSLDVAIGNLPASCPYYLNASQWDSLAKHCTEWSNAPKGPEATLPEVEYLYRLISIHTLLNKHNRTKYDEPAREVHNELMAQYQKTQTWLPLRDLIAGNLKGPRGFTFWTSYDLSIDVVRGACKVGLPFNYVVSQSVILRCPVNHFRNTSNLHVPTILDGFNNAIFLATTDKDHPKGGHTISLENPENLVLGTDEYVTNDISVNIIELNPVVVSGHHFPPYNSPLFRLRDGSPLYSYLQAFYQQYLEKDNGTTTLP